MIGHSLKNTFDSLGFAYDFAFCQNKWSLKVFQNVLWSMYFKNDKVYNFFWGGGFQQNIKKKFIGSKFEKSSKFQKVKIILLKDVPIYFLIFFEVFWYKKRHKYGVHGPRNDH